MTITKKAIAAAILLILFISIALSQMSASIFSKTAERAARLPVKISRVHLKLFPLEFGIYNMEIGNLKGFQGSKLAVVPEIFVKFDVLALFKNRVHIPEIRINISDIYIEKNAAGKLNLLELSKIMKSRQSAGEPPQSPAPAPSGAKEPMKLEVDQAVFNLGRAVYQEYGPGPLPVSRKEFSLNVKDFILYDAADPFEATMQIITVVLKKIGMGIMSVQVDQLEGQASKMFGGLAAKFSKMFH